MFFRMSEVPTNKTKYNDDVNAGTTSAAVYTDFAFTPDTLPSYIYQPLESKDTVRILCLDAAKIRTTPLSGSIVHVSRDALLTRPSVYSKYAAVSYAWGNPDFTRQLRLRVGAVRHDEYVTITPEVEHMLVELRKPSKRRYLWIDAICLNQQDDAEKSQQIPLMGDIYYEARKVIFWLGLESDGEIAEVFTYLRRLALRANESQSDFNINHEAWQQVDRFFQRPWFFRRWVCKR
jgi:hypothetical protein